MMEFHRAFSNARVSIKELGNRLGYIILPDDAKFLDPIRHLPNGQALIDFSVAVRAKVVNRHPDIPLAPQQKELQRFFDLAQEEGVDISTWSPTPGDYYISRKNYMNEDIQNGMIKSNRRLEELSRELQG